MFATATPKTVLRLFIAVAVLAGLGYVAHLGEDGQLMSSNIVSTWLYGMAAIVLYYALLVSFIVWRRKRRGGDGDKA